MLTEPQRRRQSSQQRNYVTGMNSACNTWIEFPPYCNEMMYVLTVNDGGIQCKIHEVVHDNSKKQIGYHEGTQEYEWRKERVAE